MPSLKDSFLPCINASVLLGLLLLSGCKMSSHTTHGATKPSHPMVDGLPNGQTRGVVDLPIIELASGDVAWTTFTATTIDTRAFPDQFQGEPWGGDTRRPGTILPPHSRDKTLPEDPPNGLVAGGMISSSRVDPGVLFPTIYQTPWSPPDPSLAVGPNHVAVTVNMAVAFYDRDGNEQFFANLDSTGNPGFFEDIGAGSFTFDPKCFYDHDTGRFVIMALEAYDNPDEGWITIAISDDSDPNGIWYKYRTWAVVSEGGTEYWPDYPGLGFDDNSIYVTANLFGFSGGFGGALYRVFDKTPMLTGDPVSVMDLRHSNSASVQVAQCLDNRDAPLFVSLRSQNRISIQSIESVSGTPQIVTSNINVPAYQGPNNDAPNPGGGFLDTLDGRLMNAIARQNGLWTSHAIRDANNDTKARWYHFDVESFPGGSNPSLVESGDVDLPNGTFAFFPAIAVNQFGDAAMVFAQASATDYASIQATGRRAGDPAGTMGTPVMLAQGDTGTDGRWGDYFDMTVDPIDNSTFWLIGEYATDVGWQTWVGTLEISCPGDLTDDGVVNVDDVLAVLSAFGGAGMGGDANGDGQVDVNDILVVISSWGACPGSP